MADIKCHIEYVNDDVMENHNTKKKKQTKRKRRNEK